MDSSFGSTDQIQVEELELFARVGVTESERAKPQRLTLNMTAWPRRSFQDLQDDIAAAVDYSALCRTACEFVMERSDCLMETLASGLADKLLAVFDLRRIRLELRKFVLPDVKYVAVIVTRAMED